MIIRLQKLALRLKDILHYQGRAMTYLRIHISTTRKRQEFPGNTLSALFCGVCVCFFNKKHCKVIPKVKFLYFLTSSVMLHVACSKCVYSRLKTFIEIQTSYQGGFFSFCNVYNKNSSLLFQLRETM